MDDTNVDTELWALLRWIIEDVGGECHVEDLDAAGRLYHLSAATTRCRDQCSPPVHSASALNSLASCRITPDSGSNWPTPGLAREHGLGVGEARVPALSERGLTIDYHTVWDFVHGEKLSYKKKTLIAAEQDRADVARRRAQWSKYRDRIDPSRLVFIDETWTKTNMAPLRGWAPCGERIKAKVPHGHWQTVTFLAALRHDRITAP